MPVCAPGFLPAGPPDDPRELAQHTWIRATPAPLPWRRWCAAVGHPDLEPRRYFDVANALLGADAAKRGIGIWIDGGDAVNGSGLQYHGGKLVLAHAFHAFLGDIGYHLAVRPSKRDAPMVQACREWMIELHRDLRRFAVTSGENA
jgi:DNA-binding transcriptional LysR family regulator